MKTPAETTWTCPECGERIPVPFNVNGRGKTLQVSITETAVADAVAHAWTHTERA